MKISGKNRNAVYLILIVYRVIYEYIYAYYVSPLFSYAHLVYTPNWGKMVVSYVLFTILLLALPKKFERPSEYLLNIFFMFTIIPVLAMYWQMDKATAYILVCFISFLILCFINRYFIRNRSFKPLLKESISINISSILSVVVICSMLLLTVRYGVADLRALDIHNVYSIRGERSFTGLWAYLINWLPYSFIPALMCISLYEKKYAYTFLAVIAQVYLYLFTGSKTTLFSVGLVLFSYYIAKKKINFAFAWGGALCVLNGVTTFLYGAFNHIGLFDIFPVRLLSIPPQCTFMHYDFFSVNRKLYLCETFIGRVFGLKSPYDKFSTYLVNSYGDANANTGYLADAYDNGGFIFMIIYSVILAWILRYIDSVYERGNKERLPVFVGLFTYTMIYLNDGSLTAALVTGGLIINIVICLIYNRKRDKEQL